MDVKKISILGRESIHCGFHLVPYIVETVLTTLPSSTYVLITDSVVKSFHLKKFQDAFAAASIFSDTKGRRFLYYVVPPGELSKSRQGKAEIEDFLLENRCTRDTVILALGGGVIGDLVGFVAATFMRGVRFCQIPTTLLAMVDSSVGGKTAIDTPHGKNLIGAFWQPEYIFIDPAFLETLPPREFSNGMAEVIKTAAIREADEFASLESGFAEIFAAIHSPTNDAGHTQETRTPAQDLLLSVIVGSISVKAHIVTVDERETGLRNLVNFGHTIGHAIEAVLTPTILHGECVSVGMVLEAEIARHMGVLSQVAVGRLLRCLKAYNLPISLSDPRIASLPAAKQLTVDRLLDIMKIDKKNSGPVKKIVILSAIGNTYEEKATEVPDDIIRRALCQAVRVIADTPAKAPVEMATPGSKSISNRALLLAALGEGRCELKNLLHSDDTQVMISALVDLNGAKFSWKDGGETLIVEGGRGSLSTPLDSKEIYLGNAGTAARFLTTVCTLVEKKSESQPTTVITGNARMKQRPIAPLVDALRSNGSSIAYKESEGCLPLAISPGGLKGGKIRLAASVSSQYVSSILLCAPYADSPVELELTGGHVISQPYIDMTTALMRQFGIDVTRHTDPQTGKFLDVYTVPQGKYMNPPVFSIESDASSATYPLAIAAITGTTCTISNIGSASLQGDARFAKDVLERMGCSVVQTETTTTVTGPPRGQLRAIGEVDMEPMTDAFLTASVLAAVATEGTEENGKKVTRIIGIANQRVKECNRIKAMIDQLSKFGVETNELPDGLEVYGKPIEDLVQNVSVHCYDDHRVAMAFSVLGTVVRGTILEEKRCVEKTWPDFWDSLENKIGIKVEGVELSPASSQGSPSKYTSKDTVPSVVLIGMRGSGKTFVGGLGAAALDWPFVDADEVFEEHHQIGVRQFVQDRGWDAFRKAETEILLELLNTKATGHIISLGGGIVETQSAREALKAYTKKEGPVVYVRREIAEIVKYLGEETARPAYGEPIETVFKRREPWFEECSLYDFANFTGPAVQLNNEVRKSREYDFSVIPGPHQRFRAEVERFFGHITGVKPNYARLEKGRQSFMLSPVYPDVRSLLNKFDDITAGVDVVELRVDQLRAPDTTPSLNGQYVPPITYVREQLSLLRLGTPLPIVFTVRTVSQGGAFPDGKQDEAFELLEVGRRMGCEYIDLELVWNQDRIGNFVQRKGASRIIASWHDWSGDMKWDGVDIRNKYSLAHRFGDVVKIVGKAVSHEDQFTLHRFVKQSKARPDAKPFLAVNTGYMGQISRVLNGTLSPVTHPSLPGKAAPGQISFADTQRVLHLIGCLPAKKFYLFGSPISKSPSPTLHNTIFEAMGLPYKYELFETEKVDERIEGIIREPDFGGASVTIPHKLDIMPLMDELSEHANVIGAVNTVIALSKEDGSRVLRGDNTDWLGILNTVKANLPPGITTPKVGLIIGAGGTSRAAIYALHKLGVELIYLFNRTRTSAEKLAAAFPSLNIRVIDSLSSFAGERPTVIVSTVPGNALAPKPCSVKAWIASLASLYPGERIYIPVELFKGTSGVVVDMAYVPKESVLLSTARKVHGWKVVFGVQVLLEQGYYQSIAWTSRFCPREVAAERVREQWLNTPEPSKTVSSTFSPTNSTFLVTAVAAGVASMTLLYRFRKLVTN